MSITVERPTSDELQEQRSHVLAHAGLTYDEIRALAQEYMLTDDEVEVWDEVRRIDFLLGND